MKKIFLVFTLFSLPSFGQIDDSIYVKKKSKGSYSVKWVTKDGTKDGNILSLKNGIYLKKLYATSSSNSMKFEAITRVIMIR